ncbi:MAG TPA: nitroreductase [Polyangiaceae bacterium]|nr:nitroreductase [Polyangiaceae bacterium]
MNAQELILTRRTIHDYQPGPVPEGAVERAVTAAMAAPNHRMTEPWRFVRVGPEARRALVDISADLKGGAAAIGEPGLEKLRAKMLNPAELLVVCQTRNDDPDVAHEDYAAVACAVQNAMLSFWSEGVGSKWSTGGVTTDERTYKTLGIDAEKETIVGFFWAGRALRADVPKPRRRRSLDDVLRSVP